MAVRNVADFLSPHKSVTTHLHEKVLDQSDITCKTFVYVFSFVFVYSNIKRKVNGRRKTATIPMIFAQERNSLKM